MQANTDAFNAKLAAIIKRKQGDGQQILSVPIDITAADLSDKKHPNGDGYAKMAEAWYKGIIDAHERGWIGDPAKVDAPGMGLGYGDPIPDSGGRNCGDKNWKSQGQVFDGFRVWDDEGTIFDAVKGATRDKVILADLNNDGHTDYILAYDGGAVKAWINTGEENNPWVSLGEVNPDWEKVTGDMIRMADVDNDGKADLIVLYSDGAAKVWKNVDNGRKFESLDPEWASGLGESREKVHFKDMDGDGYADYVILYEGGSVDWARNTHNNGKDKGKRNWEREVTIAPGPDGVPNNRAQLYDIDGDGLTGKFSGQ
jgi:hypothetical protein